MSGSNDVHRVVVVSASAATRATVALNLAAAVSLLGCRVTLRDDDGMVRAALGAASNAVTLPGAGGEFTLVDSPDGAHDATCEMLVSHAADANADTVRDASLLLVPVDSTAEAARTLADVAARVRALHPAPRVRVAMARTLPRGVDRWSLVERVEETLPGALYGTTIPVARRTIRNTTGNALLFGSGTRAAHAYGTLASDVLADLA